MAVDVEKAREYYMQVREYLDTLIIGEGHAKDVLTTSLLCDKNSRILLMGKPGTAKSTISNLIAKNFESKKISITSDLLPSDILNSISKTPNLQLLQLEELNRASGKVQSSLIELLAEGIITTDDDTLHFDDFQVIATQNDSEISGIFDVPQAIYDRIDVSIKMGNLTREELEEVLFDYKAKSGKKANFDLSKIIEETSAMVSEFPYGKTDRDLFMDATDILNTAKYGNDALFASSNVRGHQMLMEMASLHALVEGRKSLMPDDLSDYINNVYLHRINQAILKINNIEAKKKMQELEKQVLSLKRGKINR